MKFKIGDKLRIVVQRNQLRFRTFKATGFSRMLDNMIDNIDYKKPVIVVKNFGYSNYDYRVDVPTLDGDSYSWGYSTENLHKVFKYYQISKRVEKAKAVRKIRNNILIGGKDARRNEARKRISQGNIN